MTDFGRLGFIGVGTMGGRMCRNLAARSGLPVSAYDVDADRLAALADAGITAATSITDVIASSDLIFMCLPGEAQVREVGFSPRGLVEEARSGQVVVDMTTPTVSGSRELAEALRVRGVEYADAPVAKGVPSAQDGTLSIMVGASDTLYRRIEPLLRTMGTDISLCGAVGAGQVVKLMNNMMIFQTVPALSEALAIGTRAGVDAKGCGLHLIFFMIPDEIVSITIEGRDIAVTTLSITRDGDRITIQVEVTLSGSMLACEESILDALNEAGSTATREALQRFDTDGARLELGGQPWFSQGRQPKYYQTPYGEVEIERHVYQRSHGGKTFCPLERDGRIVVTSTPRFAKVISHKFSTGSSTAVRTDLMDNHARTVARSYLQRVAEAVGAVAQAKEESWSYATPRIHGEVASVAIGLDGTCKLLCEQGWREAMTGTISLYDGEGERLHTIYLGATPEYGKGRFVARLEGEIAHVRSLYPSATYVGVADGAQCNWDILSGHTDEQILDFYHASGYVGDAAKAAYPGDESERARWIRERCHALKHRQGAASRILKQMRAIDTRGLSAERRDKLDAAITYFANHKHQMHYSRYRKQSLPMGSGVTEAACKTLIKQRLCQSGMRWKDKGAGIVLSLRSLMLTRGRWQQFWAKLDQYGMPALR